MIVQSMKFKHTNVVGNAITAVDFFNTWAIDEIILLDASRTPDNKKLFCQTLDELSKRCFVPLTVGGWITSLHDIRLLLERGADKVIINTHAVKSPEFIDCAAKTFGNQCIVVSIDSQKNDSGEYEVVIDRGREPAGKHPVKWAKQAEFLGAGEIFITSIDHDGQRTGYDLNLVKQVSSAIEIPVIASGGVGEWQHLVDGIQQGHADAVSAANIFHYTEQSTKHAKMYMKEKRIEVRTPVFYHIILPRQPKYIV